MNKTVTVQATDLEAVLDWADEAAQYLIKHGLMSSGQYGPCYMALRTALRDQNRPSYMGDGFRTAPRKLWQEC